MAMGLVLAVIGFTGGTLLHGDGGKTITRWTLADLKFNAVPGGPLTVAAWASPSGAYCNFVKFPKGTKIPLHHHTADVSAVVMAVEFGSREEGSTAKLASVGAYQFIPGGLVHTTECGAAADCVIFACGPAAFDLVEAKAPAK
jgi:hypothetical protein